MLALRAPVLLVLLGSTSVHGFLTAPPAAAVFKARVGTLASSENQGGKLAGGARGLAANAALAIDDPMLGAKLTLAEFSGIRNEEVNTESYAWSHASRNEASIILQLTARIEKLGGKAAPAAADLVARRRQMFNILIQHDYSAYIAASTAVGGLIAREDLPNVQDVPHPSRTLGEPQRVDRRLVSRDLDGVDTLVPDCTLPNVTFAENPLDVVLLKVFRALVASHTGYQSPTPGILGLLEQGREYMLRPGQTAEAQHVMVNETLKGLLTPVMPPIYHTFMSGTNLGLAPGPGLPWAAWLTSFVTPAFFSFLVGPSRTNRRKDGKLGGLVVDKCKFLQESGCKGLCMNQCKLPAQSFFRDGLGLSLTVSPNFETQECQWSFGEEPLPPDEDPGLPPGCLVGCPTREALREEKVSRPCY